MKVVCREAQKGFEKKGCFGIHTNTQVSYWLYWTFLNDNQPHHHYSDALFDACLYNVCPSIFMLSLATITLFRNTEISYGSRLTCCSFWLQIYGRKYMKRKDYHMLSWHMLVLISYWLQPSNFPLFPRDLWTLLVHLNCGKKGHHATICKRV